MNAPYGWSYHPYQPPLFDTGKPYICRIVPDETTILLEWLPLSGVKEYTVMCGRRNQEMNIVGHTRECAYQITGLDTDCEYQFQVLGGDCSKSRIRLARTGSCPGTIVNYLHPDDSCYAFSGSYLCSPSMVRHPDGYLLASMDLFGSGTPQNLTLIFRSDDDGATWHYVSELFPCFWGKMFIHRGRLYMLGCSTEYGDLLIGCSLDGGKTFSTPTVLFRGSCHCKYPGIHKNPQPVVEYNHRLWNTLEWGSWAIGTHAPMVMSADVDADLLDANSWKFTPPLPYDSSWEGVAKGPSAGNIEGTLVIAPDQKLYNVMRYDMHRCEPNYGLALAYRVDADQPENTLQYAGALPYPGNHSKFEIHYDAVSGRYWSICSRILDSANAGSRNLLSLIFSTDLQKWELACDLIDRRNEDPATTGFQYVDFFFEGNDLLFLCRTAVNHPHNYHDSNYQTFHRLKDFRQLLNHI